MLKRTIAVAAACAVVLAAAVVPALAKKPSGKLSSTKLAFKLDDHSVDSGSNVTGEARLTTTKGKSKTPIAGATLTVTLDGADTGTVVTDANGVAAIVITAPADGEHNVKVSYAGDATRRKAQAAQGFSVGADDEEPEEPEPSPSPSV